MKIHNRPKADHGRVPAGGVHTEIPDSPDADEAATTDSERQAAWVVSISGTAEGEGLGFGDPARQRLGHPGRDNKASSRHWWMAART
jgi:hypothetical protein